MRYIFKTSLLLVCWLGTGSAIADITADELLNSCKDMESDDYFSHGMCIGYIDGIMSGYEAAINDANTVFKSKYPNAFAKTNKIARVPWDVAGKKITRQQTALIVSKFLKDHPESLHLSAGTQVLLALTVAFPDQQWLEDYQKYNK